jgi:hypothetical protein
MGFCTSYYVLLRDTMPKYWLITSGVPRKSNANPWVGLRLEMLYGTPVLMFWLSSLVLCTSKMSIIDKCHKDTYQNIQKLLPKTSQCVFTFLAAVYQRKL